MHSLVESRWIFLNGGPAGTKPYTEGPIDAKTSYVVLGPGKPLGRI